MTATGSAHSSEGYPRASLAVEPWRWQTRYRPWLPVVQSYHGTDPLFRLEVRRLPYVGDLDGLGRWTRRIIGQTLLLLAALALLGAIFLIRDFVNNYLSGTSVYSYYAFALYPYYALVVQMISMWGASLLMISVLVGFLMDFNCVSAGAGVTDRELTAGRRDLLRITLLPEASILHTQLILTRLRTWRPLVRVVTMRVTVLLLLVLYALIPDPNQGGSLAIVVQLTGRAAGWSANLANGLMVLMFAVIFVLEAFWRHQTMTTLAVALAGDRQPTGRLLAGLGGIAAVWLSQGFGIYLLVMVNSAGNRWIFDTFYTYQGSLQPTIDYQQIINAQLAFALLTVMLTALGIIAYYRLLNGWLTRRALRRMFADAPGS